MHITESFPSNPKPVVFILTLTITWSQVYKALYSFMYVAMFDDLAIIV
jgi:hypothetical protein